MSKFEKILERLEKRCEQKIVDKKVYFIKKGECKAYLDLNGKSRILVIYFECSNNIIKNEQNKVAVIIVEKTIVWKEEIRFLLIEGLTKKANTFCLHANVEIKKAYNLNSDISFGVIGSVSRNKSNIILDSEIITIKIINIGDIILPDEIVSIISEKEITIDDWRKEHIGVIQYPFWLNKYETELRVK